MTRSVISVHILALVSMRKYILNHKINTQYNCFQNNTAQLYFILGRAKLHWNFSSLLRDASDIHRFSNSAHG